MTKSTLAEFVVLASSAERINGDTPEGAGRKDQFHRQGRAILVEIAKLLGLKRGTFEIWSNKAGVAVCGEVTLHAEWLYLQLSGHPDRGALYRSCKGRQDYTGGTNLWLPWQQLLDLPTAAEILRAVQEGS